MNTDSNTPVRIQKVGDTSQHACVSAAGGVTEKSTGHTISAGKAFPGSVAAATAEPKVEVRELETGIFEITVTCGCGKKAVVRCESLISNGPA